MTKQRNYYALIVLEDGRFTWAFGAYDQVDVKYEREDMHDHGYKYKDMQIIRFDHCPLSIEVDQFLHTLNTVKG